MNSPSLEDLCFEEECLETEKCWRYYKIRKTLLEMLRARGYLISQTEMDFNPSDFKKKYSLEPNLLELEILAQHSKAKDCIRCSFVQTEIGKKVGKEAIKKTLNQMTRDKISKAIIVIQSGLSHGAKTLIEEGKKSQLFIETFLENELIVNITKHQRASPHVLLTTNQKKELLEKYKIKDSQLPRILSNDPIVRYLGGEKGQVVKITRKSQTAETYDTYRIIMNT